MEIDGGLLMAAQRDFPFLQNLARRFRKPAEIHVLMVDPDQTAARLLVSGLQPSFSVKVVASAEAAHATLSTHLPTIVVTELDLPGATGLDLLRSLRMDPATRRVLLMVLTARIGLRDKIAAFQSGADDYLVKPVDPQQVTVHLERLSLFRQVLPPSAS
jgi:two-component system, OmpR family, phosphate regulon response regulator PhoB